MPWGAAIAAGGAIVGGLISSNAQKDAANTQADATNKATQTQIDQYNQTRQDNLPLLTARNDALARLEQLLGVNGGGSGGIDSAAVMSDPGYQFGLNQGQRQLEHSFNARGMRDSGAALKAASEFGNDYATTKYDAALNRQLNPLQSLAGLGQSGANTIATAGSQTAGAVSNLQSGLGNALAASQLAQGNTYANTANQLAGWYQNYSRNSSAPPAGFTTDGQGGYYNQQPWTVGPNQG